MTNTGDFDPAEAILQQRAAEEAEKQRALSRQNNILKLLRYADEQLEEIRNPVVSEFVVTEKWWTPESKTTVSDKRGRKDFEKTLRANQRIISCDDGGSFFRPRFIYTVATRHEHQRQTRYYGSWLSLDCIRNVDSKFSSYRRGLMKLRQPCAGYAEVDIHGGWDPRNVGHINRELTDYAGKEKTRISSGINPMIHESLETAPVIPIDILSDRHIKQLTESVKRALDFVATGQPPTPFEIGPTPFDVD